MKLLIALIVVSTLLLKPAEGQSIANDEPCTAIDECAGSNAGCQSDGTGLKCLCEINYENDESGGMCLLTGDQNCVDPMDCYSGKCTNGKCEGKAADGAICTSNFQCVSFNCKVDGSTQKCAPASGASAVAASLILMVPTLVTSRFL